MKKKKPKQGSRPELGLCNVAEEGADYASGTLGVQGDSPPTCACLDLGPAVSRSKEHESAAWLNHFKALFLRQWVSILLRL